MVHAFTKMDNQKKEKKSCIIEKLKDVVFVKIYGSRV